MNDLPVSEAPSPPRRTSATDWVCSEILAWIEGGKYHSGEFLPSERELQALFGVSRVVVREAVVRLQAVGLVAVEHGRGCRVSSTIPDLLEGPFRTWLSLNRSEVVNLLLLRRALDGLAAEQAAWNAGKDVIADIEVAAQSFAEAVEAGADPARLVSLDKKFHVTVAKASGIAVVEQLLGELDHHSANIHRASIAMGRRPVISAREHQTILSAIADGKPESARLAAERHVHGSIDQVQVLLAGFE